MKKHNLAFIDLETTGLNPEKHEIIEIGCIIAKQIPQDKLGAKIEIIEEFELKVRPEHLETAEPEALRINGYNDADWLFAVDLKKAMELISEKTKDCVMVGLNIAFNAEFLDQAFTKTGIKNQMHFHKIEVMSMAFAKLYHKQDVERFSLHYLAEHFGVKNENAHTALADIRTTFEVYKKILEI
ncbi:MAG: 3'-5' exonuclease [bacterium]